MFPIKIAVVLILSAVQLIAGEKPAFFRADGGVAVHSGKLPGDLDEAGALRWRTPLDAGHSSPIAHSGRIFLTTYRPEDRELATVAIDQNSGRILWKKAAPVTQLEQVHAQSGSPATPTPACDGQRVYSFFGSFGLLCYDLNGEKLWERRLGPFQDEYGAGSSPILAGGKLILQQDHDKDSFIAACDPSNGSTLWQTARPDAVRSYATPVLWKRNGAEELLAAGALELAGYDVATGQKQWWVNGLARIVIPAPVHQDGMIFMASWAPGGDSGKRIALDAWPQAIAKWDKNKDNLLTRQEVESPDVLDRFFRMDLDQNGKLSEAEWERHADVFRRAQNSILALKIDGKGDQTEKAVVWKHLRGIPYVPTPAWFNGMIWMVKEGGIVTKLDAATGELIQEERLPGLGGYFASPVAGDGKIFFASEQGMVTIMAGERSWTVLSSRPFQEKIYATPAIGKERIFIRTEKALYAYGPGHAAK